MIHIQQSWFIDLICDHPEVFSLHDEDLGLCEWIRHTIPTTMDRPVYLLHHIIPPQLQGEVHKYLEPGCDKALSGHHKVLIHPR